MHNLWNIRAREKRLRGDRERSVGRATVHRLSYRASLVWLQQPRNNPSVLHHSDSRQAPITVHTAVHRFEETIGGRAYQIEVAPIDTDRWRAYIVRVPGVPTALMPFYGVTPDEAAGNLRQWLTRAHSRVASSNKKPPA